MKVAWGGQWPGHSAGLEKSISRMVISLLASTSTILARTPNAIAFPLFGRPGPDLVPVSGRVADVDVRGEQLAVCPRHGPLV